MMRLLALLFLCLLLLSLLLFQLYRHQLPLFDASILKPNLHLALGEFEQPGQKLTVVAHEIHLLLELVLESSELLRRKGGPDAFGLLVLADRRHRSHAQRLLIVARLVLLLVLLLSLAVVFVVVIRGGGHFVF